MPGPPLPRPVLPRERGYLDKFVEFLVGDGPTNRYALICRQCESHNGMALREEFEYIAFRCCYCYYWNPARKQRPVAPRLTPAAERPAVQSASDSSGQWRLQSPQFSPVLISFSLFRIGHFCTKQHPSLQEGECLRAAGC